MSHLSRALTRSYPRLCVRRARKTINVPGRQPVTVRTGGWSWAVFGPNEDIVAESQRAVPTWRAALHIGSAAMDEVRAATATRAAA